MRKVLILDLDNTIYSAESIGEELFATLFEILDNSDTRLSDKDLKKMKADIMKKPFQKVAEEYNLNKETTEKALAHLRNLTFDSEIKPFEEYRYLKEIKATKFLVTTGFLKLQQSKVKQMGIEEDFKEIFIVDPDTSQKTKKDVFEEIIRKYNYNPEEILIIGDDPESEIKAGNDLKLKTFLIDLKKEYPQANSTYKGYTLKDIEPVLRQG